MKKYVYLVTNSRLVDNEQKYIKVQYSGGNVRPYKPINAGFYESIDGIESKVEYTQWTFRL